MAFISLKALQLIPNRLACLRTVRCHVRHVLLVGVQVHICTLHGLYAINRLRLLVLLRITLLLWRVIHRLCHRLLHVRVHLHRCWCICGRYQHTGWVGWLHRRLWRRCVHLRGLHGISWSCQGLRDFGLPVHPGLQRDLDDLRRQAAELVDGFHPVFRKRYQCT